MGGTVRKLCWCCFPDQDEDEYRPLLDDENTENFCSINVEEEEDRINLLEEHDKIYTIHGERKKTNTDGAFQRGYSTNTRGPIKKDTLKRSGSWNEPLVASSDSEDEEEDDEIVVPPTKRRLTAMELLQTETSYIRNLKIIVEVYKVPLEVAIRKGAPIIDAEDIKQIFGGVSEILAVHMDIHKDLSEVVEDWQENCRIAGVITKYQERLTKVYPPYVNYFDMGKDVIVKQQKSNADFSEFMINCFNNPTCLKQPLDVLLIRPVQRLPSMSLLIQDLRRRTPEDLDDWEALEAAVDSLKTVLSQINEDKRKTEGRTKIFDILYQVDSCPDNLVSSNRLFVARSDVTTLNDGLYRTGERLALFLLTDIIEVTKWKRSPRKNAPLLKHIMTLPLTSVTSVLDIADCDDNAPMFGIELKDEMVESNGTIPWKPLEKLCICQPLDGRYHMGSFLKSLSEQIAINNNRNSKDVLQNVQPSEVQPMIKKGNKLLRRILSKSKHE